MKKSFVLAAVICCQLFFVAQANDCMDRWTQAFDNHEVSAEYIDLLGKCDSELLDELNGIARRGHRSLSYDGAREFLFGKLDNENGYVCSVYDNDRCIRTEGIPNPNIMNCEHTWPKSLGASSTPAKSDLHHLYVTTNQANSRRSSWPFCEVVQEKWTNDASVLGYDDHHDLCFEPPAEHKGNVARSLFYFSVRYKKDIDRDEEAVLRRWHKEDPVDEAELYRHQRIVEKQKNVNPFILQPYLVDLISDF